MRLTRYLREECVKLRADTKAPDAEAIDAAREAGGAALDRLRWRVKESILRELAELFEASGRIGSVNRLHTDLVNREKKASTGIGGALAIPHVRTVQAKEFLVAVLLCPEGLDFNALDEEPVKVFVSMVSPPYDDRTYLQVYPRIGDIFGEEWRMDALLEAEHPGEVLRFLASV